MNLKQLKVGQSAIIKKVGGQGAIRQHFLDMGIIVGSEVTLVKFAPMGDPMEVSIHGYELTLRLQEAENIDVEIIENRSNKHKHVEVIYPSNHPGLGQDGLYHDYKNNKPLKDDEILTFALMGNQNCGKTTLFNQLTGSNQHVGNFPGVTIDAKQGSILKHPNTLITDLPGIYSMSPYTAEEVVSRDFVLKNKPKAIINIVDATNIERNLYLTLQLLEMRIPMVIALNMMDELVENHGSIDINKLEGLLGVPVVPISASKNQGINELVEHVLHVAKYQERPPKLDFCNEDDHNGSVHKAIHATVHLIHDRAKEVGLPVRFSACKAIENDKLILEQLKLDKNELELLDKIASQMEEESHMDRAAAIADMRFDFIERACETSVHKPSESIQRIRSEKIDKVLTNKYTAIPMFILIMGLVFYLTFNLIGPFFQNYLQMGIDALAIICDNALTKFGISNFIQSLIIDGIFKGVGSVVSFLPIVVTLFFFLSLMEDTGYIARVAFFMDKLVRKIGLSGRSIVPLILGFGCSVPAVMSSRTLPSSRDRKLTILLVPFMSCSAKLPIYAFFANVFFKGYEGIVMIGAYLLNIVLGVILALIYKKTIFKGEAVPFCMELPNYRLPTIKSVAQLVWDKAKDFLNKAFSIILVATVIIWLLQSIDIHFNIVTESSSSLMALISSFLVPLFKPLGLGDWRIVTSLISGFMAKESVVTSMEILFGSSLTTIFTINDIIVLLVFTCLYTPCIAAVNTITKELGVKWGIGVAIFQCIFAWVIAFIVRLII